MDIKSSSIALPFVQENTAEDIRLWLRLVNTPGIGSQHARRLLALFGLPQHIFFQSLNNLTQVLNEKLAQALLAAPDAAFEDLVQRTVAWCTQERHYFLTWAHRAYPQALFCLADPPPIIYIKGNLALFQQSAIAIVGSRHASVQGQSNAEQFARSLSAAGLTVISGLALGVDTAAHKGALTEKGSTIAVIGTGIDKVYPSRNQALSEQIAQQGALLSEVSLAAPASAYHFPRRNRLMAALAQGVLVVEAAAQSGSLITARCASELGKEVFAIPGSIHSPLVKGCHYLIKQGAKLVETAQDIFEELPQLAPRPKPQQQKAKEFGLSEGVENSADDPNRIRMAKGIDSEVKIEQRSSLPDTPLTRALGFDPVDLDTLVARTGLSVGLIQTQLLEFELLNQVVQLPGGYYQRVAVTVI